MEKEKPSAYHTDDLEIKTPEELEEAKNEADVTSKNELYRRVKKFAEASDDRQLLGAAVELAKKHNDELEARFVEALMADPEISKIRARIEPTFKVNADESLNEHKADRRFMTDEESTMLWDKYKHYWDTIVDGKTVARIYEGSESLFDERIQGSTPGTALRFIFPEKTQFDFIGDDEFLGIFESHTSHSAKYKDEGEWAAGSVKHGFNNLSKYKPHLRDKMKLICEKFGFDVSE